MNKKGFVEKNAWALVVVTILIALYIVLAFMQAKIQNSARENEPLQDAVGIIEISAENGMGQVAYVGKQGIILCFYPTVALGIEPFLSTIFEGVYAGLVQVFHIDSLS